MGGTSASSRDVEDFYTSHRSIGASFRRTDGSRVGGPTRQSLDVNEVFRSSRFPDEFNPAKIKLPRQSHDSQGCPNSRPVIYALDTTGSNMTLAVEIIQSIFPEIMLQTMEAAPFDPQVMVAAILDIAAGNEAALQITQFEADMSIVEQFQRLWLPDGGGGNGFESYSLIWYFAAKYTECHSFEKRGKKGILFTFGDEGPTPRLTPTELREVFGDRPDLDKYTLSDYECLEMAREKWDVYHIVLHGHGYWAYNDIPGQWRRLMGTNSIDLADHRCIPELIATIYRMYDGKNKFEAIAAINDSHAKETVRKALSEFPDTIDDESVFNQGTEDIDAF